MDRFLASVERKAFGIARIAVGNVEEALDIVQDTMLKLVQKYAHKDEDDWPGLFYTILNSRIRDWYRRSKVRNRWRVWFGGKGEESDYDPIVESPDDATLQPEAQLNYLESAETLEKALGNLPERQQQAFLLRMWEGLSVEETAKAMGCSQGSVKTHCSRALQKLKLYFEVEEV